MISRRQFLISVPLSAALPALVKAADGGCLPRVACQANAWQIKAGDFQELLQRVADMKRLGYEAFECNVRFVEGQFANAPQARAQIENTGMMFYGTHIGLRQSPEYLDRCIDGAASLGAQHFALSGAGGITAKDGTLKQDALAKKIDAITRLATHCRKAGLRLVYHNHGEEFNAGGAEIEALLQRTDPELVSFLVDLGHAHRERADVVAFFAQHHARIDAMHLRDIRGKQQVPLGQGELDFTGLGAAIRKTGWCGWLTLEEENLPKSTDIPAIESILQSDRSAIRKFFGV